MLFEWDRVKNISNTKKHGVSFELAASVFDDLLHLSVLDHKTHSEERWITIGRCVTDKVLVVVHTYKEMANQEMIRIISARVGTRREKNQYEEGI